MKPTVNTLFCVIEMDHFENSFYNLSETSFLTGKIL